MADAKIDALETQVRLLDEQVASSRGLKREIADLKARLDKEVAFVLVLEHDTRQMADELLQVGSQYQELKENYHKDTNALRGQCSELESQLKAKDEEAMALKEEVGRLRIENKRLQDGQHKMVSSKIAVAFQVCVCWLTFDRSIASSSSRWRCPSSCRWHSRDAIPTAI